VRYALSPYIKQTRFVFKGLIRQGEATLFPVKDSVIVTNHANESVRKECAEWKAEN
jgi:hypothetical protein